MSDYKDKPEREEFSVPFDRVWTLAMARIASNPNLSTTLEHALQRALDEIAAMSVKDTVTRVKPVSTDIGEMREVYGEPNSSGHRSYKRVPLDLVTTTTIEMKPSAIVETGSDCALTITRTFALRGS